MLTIDMQMPKSCFECPLNAVTEKSGGYRVCLINGNIWLDSHDRPPLCPLKEQEVKPTITSKQVHCGNCGKIIEKESWKACPWCTMVVKYDSHNV